MDSKKFNEIFEKHFGISERDYGFWTNSPYRSIKDYDSKCRGTKAENISKDVYIDLGHEVLKPQNTEHDFIVNGMIQKKVEHKQVSCALSRMGVPKIFTYRQMRHFHDYNTFCGSEITPYSYLIWETTKEILHKYLLKHVQQINFPGGKRLAEAKMKKYGDGWFEKYLEQEMFHWQRRANDPLPEGANILHNEVPNS